jgi:hypothetical protein
VCAPKGHGAFALVTNIDFIAWLDWLNPCVMRDQYPIARAKSAEIALSGLVFVVISALLECREMTSSPLLLKGRATLLGGVRRGYALLIADFAIDWGHGRARRIKDVFG